MIMSLKVETPFGHAAPAFAGHSDGHAITSHMPKWQSILDFVDRKPELFASFVNMYPRVMLQKPVKEVGITIPEP